MHFPAALGSTNLPPRPEQPFEGTSVDLIKKVLQQITFYVPQLTKGPPVPPTDPRLDFVLIEISLGMTFVQRALTAYQSGFNEHGDSARANAEKALETACRFSGHLDAEGRLIAHAELTKLEQALTRCCKRQLSDGSG